MLNQHRTPQQERIWLIRSNKTTQEGIKKMETEKEQIVFMTITKRHHKNIIESCLIERIDLIQKRIKKIRGLKMYKEKIISNFNINDYKGYLIELNQLNNEYKSITEILKNENYPITLLTDTETQEE